MQRNKWIPMRYDPSFAFKWCLLLLLSLCASRHIRILIMMRCELGRDKIVNKTNKIIYVQEPSLMIVLRYAICMLIWKMELKQEKHMDAAVMSCSHSFTHPHRLHCAMLDLFYSGWCPLLKWRCANSFGDLLLIILTLFPPFVLAHRQRVSSNCWLYINSPSRLPRWFTKKMHIPILLYHLYDRTFYIWRQIAWLVSWCLCFILFFSGLNEQPAHFSPFSSIVHQYVIWSKQEKTAKSISHAVHDGNTYAHIIWHDYFAHLTGFVFFVSLPYREPLCSKCVGLAFEHILTFRLCAIEIAIFELALVCFNICYDLSTAHRVSNTVVCVFFLLVFTTAVCSLRWRVEV